MLRPYQSAALEAIREHLRQGRRNVLLVSPTGSGKSVLIAEMVRGAVAKGKRAIFVAHRRELIEQISERLDRDGLRHGIMMGQHSRGPHEPVQVVSIQTLVKRAPPPADLLLVDEAHHAAAKTYRKALEAYPGKPVVGYTASPWRQDGKGLADLFEASVVAATPAELIAAGYLCRYTGHAFMAPDVGAVRTVGGEFDAGALSLAYQQQSRIFGDVVAKWQQYASGMRTIVFAASIDNSLELVARFRAIGVTAEHVDYNSADIDRWGIIQRARSGATQVLCNVGLLTEGVDIPELQCCVMARPTKSLALYLQMVGRVMRPVGDKVARIHDHAENVYRHGLPDAERDYSLQPGKPPTPPVLHTCESCLAMFEGRQCPACGRALTPKAVAPRCGPTRVFEHEDVPLERVGKLPTRAEQVETFRGLLAQARELGRRPGWAVHAFIKRYPGAPKPWKAWRQAVGKDGNWL